MKCSSARFILTLAALVSGSTGLSAQLDTALQEPQFGAYSSRSSTGPWIHSLVPLSKTDSASLGGTTWIGSGVGAFGEARMNFSFVSGSGWWGTVPVMGGEFFIPMLQISGPGPVVDVAVNLEIGGTESGSTVDVYSVSWNVIFYKTDGSIIRNVGSSTTYTPNGPPSAAAPVLAGIPVGEPVSMLVTATYFLNGPNNGNTTEQAAYLRLNELEVFGLPDGYSLNSPYFNIVDNQIVSKGPGIFGDYPFVYGTYVNSGPWLGWLHAADYPWLYIYAIDAFAYISEEAVSSAGGWVFLPR